jgi:hypothetical protein
LLWAGALWMTRDIGRGGRLCWRSPLFILFGGNFEMVAGVRFELTTFVVLT